MGKKAPCDKNCFSCPHPDCICDDMTIEDYEKSETIDLICGVKVYKESEHRREYRRQYHQKNKEHINAKSREYYQKNKEKQKAYMKEYREKNKERIKLYQREQKRKYRAKKKEEEQRGN